jgi:hypothetical protein
VFVGFLPKTQSYTEKSQTPPGLFSSSSLTTTREEETTELHIKMGKGKVVRLGFAFVHREVRERKSNMP